MPTTPFPRVPSAPMNESEYVKMLADIIARFSKELEWLLTGNLDVNNIRAKTITADRMDVEELSAIAADLGTITAGIIYGAYIATSNGTFPRIEFSSVNKLLTAFNDALNHVDITASAGGSPGISWTIAGALNAYLNSTAGGPLLASFGGVQMTLQSSSHLNLDPSGSLKVNGSIGQNASISYTKTIASDGMGGYFAVNGTMNFTKGLLTSYS